MKLPIAIAVVIAALVCPFDVDAGRTGGRMLVTLTIPAGEVVYYDIPFDAGPAVVRVRGTGRSALQINMYDSDGNVAIGDGYWDRMSASMDVYRPGFFRVEIINIGAQDSVVAFETN